MHFHALLRLNQRYHTQLTGCVWCCDEAESKGTGTVDLAAEAIATLILGNLLGILLVAFLLFLLYVVHVSRSRCSLAFLLELEKKKAKKW